MDKCISKRKHNSKKKSKKLQSHQKGIGNFKHSNVKISNFMKYSSNDDFFVAYNPFFCKTFQQCNKFSKDDIINELLSRGIVVNPNFTKPALIREIIKNNKLLRLQQMWY